MSVHLKKDGTPDMRYSENKKRATEEKKRTEVEDIVKEKDGKEKAEENGKEPEILPQQPVHLKKDETTDKRYKENKTAVPLKKDGTPDRRYKVNQPHTEESKSGEREEEPVHLKKDGTPDRRYKKSKDTSQSDQETKEENEEEEKKEEKEKAEKVEPAAQNDEPIRLKKDGTPDRRYKKREGTPRSDQETKEENEEEEEKKEEETKENEPGTPVQHKEPVHLKKDGTPDRRYKENRSIFQDEQEIKKEQKEEAEKAEPSTQNDEPIHLKKDGTPDRRYKSNRKRVTRSLSPEHVSTEGNNVLQPIASDDAQKAAPTVVTDSPKVKDKKKGGRARSSSFENHFISQETKTGDIRDLKGQRKCRKDYIMGLNGKEDDSSGMDASHVIGLELKLNIIKLMGWKISIEEAKKNQDVEMRPKHDNRSNDKILDNRIFMAIREMNGDKNALHVMWTRGLAEKLDEMIKNLEGHVGDGTATDLDRKLLDLFVALKEFEK